MENTEILKSVRAKAQLWLGPEFDAETRKSVSHMLEHDEKELISNFSYIDFSGNS